MLDANAIPRTIWDVFGIFGDIRSTYIPIDFSPGNRNTMATRPINARFTSRNLGLTFTPIDGG